MKPLGPFDHYLIHEFIEDYRDGIMPRRDMIRRIIYITGGVASAATVLTSMGITPMTRAAMAQETTPATNPEPQSPLTVAADDARVSGSDITVPAQDGSLIIAYQALPASPATGSPMASPEAGSGLALVMVCHENRGLTEHICDVARRWAVEGYAAVAVDLLSREGGTDSIEDQDSISGMFSDIEPGRHVADFVDTAAYYGGVDGSMPAAWP